MSYPCTRESEISVASGERRRQRAVSNTVDRCDRVQVGHAMQFCGNWVSEFSG